MSGNHIKFKHRDIVRKKGRNDPVVFIGLSSMSNEIGIFEDDTTEEVYAEALLDYELVESVKAAEVEHFYCVEVGYTNGFELKTKTLSGTIHTYLGAPYNDRESIIKFISVKVLGIKAEDIVDFKLISFNPA
ncbi:hypothetical protein P3551_23050 [Vibrio parahaemolyticus]|uniref:hypothetical protein n=1 Tax=Vibrio parahaemolyticus TaxID=670 RepID=UPI00112266E5|nr:hypothetical protein [Vibrio parahaemolyticus]MBE3985606.1 hypothetical protein [Vibrio parahaemolyticus]MBE4286382.1 hypothetical protein [Vibrio parahaemolyticus]MDF4902164.1 hypothetical protein [Vibrio parahaemolyticus]TOH19139.1 hypothetical protein CGI90_03940 [Vibrio parahaemolyticus]HCG7330423.1 hypothetical protein [Vibrio parahaemolyticus]